MHTVFCLGRSEVEKNHLEDLVIDWGLILEWVLWK